jgi:hypothetical protein
MLTVSLQDAPVKRFEESRSTTRRRDIFIAQSGDMLHSKHAKDVLQRRNCWSRNRSQSYEKSATNFSLQVHIVIVSRTLTYYGPYLVSLLGWSKVKRLASENAESNCRFCFQ